MVLCKNKRNAFYSYGHCVFSIEEKNLLSREVVTVLNDGRVSLYSRRMVKSICNMDLTYFPWDTQVVVKVSAQCIFLVNN